MGYFRYWAKLDRTDSSRFHRVVHHCLDVGAVAHDMFARKNRFATNLLHQFRLPKASYPAAEAALTWLVALHDIGKISTGFQSLVEDSTFLKNLGTPLEPNDDGTLQLHAYTDRHDALSKLALIDIVLPALLNNVNVSSKSQDLTTRLTPLIEAVAGHHGAPVKSFSAKKSVVRLRQIPEVMTQDITSFVVELAELLGGVEHVLVGLTTLAEAAKSPGASWLLSGFTSLTDWIGSAENYFPFEDTPIMLDAYWTRHARPRAVVVLNDLMIGEGRPSEMSRFSDLFPDFKRPSPMQHATDKLNLGSESQLFLIEDLTGSGKTEAALALAGRLLSNSAHGSVYIAMPTRATANGLFPRIHDTVPKLFSNSSPNLILTHSDARTNERFAALVHSTRADDYYGSSRTDTQSSVRCSAWLSDNSKKAFFADVGVGTVDQALLGVLPAKYMTLRLLGLAGGVLILDEVHAYDAYTSRLIEQLIAAMATLGGHVILLSATLTNRQREALATAFVRGFTGDLELAVEWDAGNAYPLLTHVAPEFIDSAPARSMVEMSVAAAERSVRTLDFDTVGSIDSAVEILVEAARAGQCAVWIRNTVDSAISTYRQVRKRLDADHVHLFHSRFTRSDRNRIENDVLQRFGAASTPSERSGHVLIATQVVEQSLDLDFDVLITDLAPIDFILQRAGRWRRHRRDAEGNRLADPSAPDQRDQSAIHIICPPSDAIESAEWLDELLPYTSLIYDAPEVLWRTARSLATQPTVRLPEDARARLEHVYARDDLGERDWPDCLEQEVMKSRNVEHADSSYGVMRSFEIERQLYKASRSPWVDEEDVQTRLIEDQVQLRFVWLDDDSEISPWHSDDWKSGDLSIPYRHCAELLQNEHMGRIEEYDWANIVAQACKLMPDRGRHVHLLPFARASAVNTFRTRTTRQEEVTWTYDEHFGLQRNIAEDVHDEI